MGAGHPNSLNRDNMGYNMLQIMHQDTRLVPWWTAESATGQCGQVMEVASELPFRKPAC